jgi:hypothetical protein
MPFVPFSAIIPLQISITLILDESSNQFRLVRPEYCTNGNIDPDLGKNPF